ncbi:TetR/AcrR family transcriptional regulator [uncultured Methanobrevibacter sp.]|uniref:TetR/AcrR family transcriptional regulator n=1 Tax=uncultured Methanobrevibacter sp. TaxID=253161 RepID=UPI0025E42F17|nr:TetR/AcrR family transcriptional regulator [uncultured Methanobrevibacter sp.]
MNNKEKIFHVSIDLFSKYGYDGVSVRKIASEVGIKESSIYNHYKSKESILDSILEYYIGVMTKEEIPLAQASENLDVSFDYFYNFGLKFYIDRLKEADMMKITRIILVEAYHNEKIRTFVKQAIIEGPINGWIVLFDLMEEKGLIKADCNSRQLAESFYYYDLFLLIEHFIVNYPQDDEEFLMEFGEKTQIHIKLLYDSVKI